MCGDPWWCQYDFRALGYGELHLIVPLGREASRGDQIENAAYFVKKGYAEELQESDLTLKAWRRNSILA